MKKFHRENKLVDGCVKRELGNGGIDKKTVYQRAFLKPHWPLSFKNQPFPNWLPAGKTQTLYLLLVFISGGTMQQGDAHINIFFAAINAGHFLKFSQIRNKEGFFIPPEKH